MTAKLLIKPSGSIQERQNKSLNREKFNINNLILQDIIMRDLYHKSKKNSEVHESNPQEDQTKNFWRSLTCDAGKGQKLPFHLTKGT